MEKKLKVTFSASNEKTVNAGNFDIIIYEPLEDKEIMHQISDLILDQVNIEGLKNITININ